jgi:hypothetical protein
MENQIDDKDKPHANSRTKKESIQENLLVIVVLIFSFIYFLFQLYMWFGSPQG